MIRTDARKPGIRIRINNRSNERTEFTVVLEDESVDGGELFVDL